MRIRRFDQLPPQTDPRAAACEKVRGTVATITQAYYEGGPTPRPYLERIGRGGVIIADTDDPERFIQIGAAPKLRGALRHSSDFWRTDAWQAVRPDAWQVSTVRHTSTGARTVREVVAHWDEESTTWVVESLDAANGGVVPRQRTDADAADRAMLSEHEMAAIEATAMQSAALRDIAIAFGNDSPEFRRQLLAPTVEPIGGRGPEDRFVQAAFSRRAAVHFGFTPPTGAEQYRTAFQQLDSLLPSIATTIQTMGYAAVQAADFLPAVPAEMYSPTPNS